jgi:phosphoenolpyruvate-protein kinase (PTS system EI component)
MFPSAICRLSVPLAAGIFRASIAVAETTTVGVVDKVQAQVQATQAGQTRALAVQSEVYFRDRCHSTEGARLQATLKDGTQLTLGENATLVVDEFIYDPSMSRGELSVGVIRGAFLYVGVRSKGWPGRKCRYARRSGR